jgi:hypothetical protein
MAIPRSIEMTFLSELSDRFAWRAFAPLAERVRGAEPRTRNAELLDGLLMNPTFKIIPCFVGAILMLAVRNMEIPICSVFGFSLDRLPVVSEQDRAMGAVCKGMRICSSEN